jgi:hypothetical protein
MGNQHITKLLTENGFSTTETNFIFADLFYLFGNSLIIGLILTIISYMALLPRITVNETIDDRPKTLMGLMNILFLTVGLTGIMILVDNNLARALSIGAALGLTRFRIKLGSKNLGSNLLFSILAGVACGLNEVQLAWFTTGVYIIIQSLILLILRYINRDSLKADHHGDSI